MGPSRDEPAAGPAPADSRAPGPEEAAAADAGPPAPPEGGWGWLVMLAAMWCNGSVFGIQNACGVLFVSMLKTFGAADEDGLAFKTGGPAGRGAQTRRRPGCRPRRRPPPAPGLRLVCSRVSEGGRCWARTRGPAGHGRGTGALGPRNLAQNAVRWVSPRRVLLFCV